MHPVRQRGAAAHGRKGASGQVHSVGWMLTAPAHATDRVRSELPEWYEHNPFIWTAYRDHRTSFCGCVSSVCGIHNETGNIWTHLLGGVVWAGASLHALASRDLAVRADGAGLYLPGLAPPTRTAPSPSDDAARLPRQSIGGQISPSRSMRCATSCAHSCLWRVPSRICSTVGDRCGTGRAGALTTWGSLRCGTHALSRRAT